MKYSITVEVQVDNDNGPRAAAQIAFDIIRSKEVEFVVGTMSGPQVETRVNTLDLD